MGEYQVKCLNLQPHERMFVVNDIVLTLAICFLAGIFPAGAAFVLGCLIAGCQMRWYAAVLGALAADTAALIFDGNTFLFWTLFAAAAVCLSLFSLPRTAFLSAAALILLRTQAGAKIYIPLFAASAAGAILLFTIGKKYGIIKKIKVERKIWPWRKDPTTTKV